MLKFYIDIMKRSKKKLAICPSCLEEKHRTEIKTCISILEKIEKREFKHFKEFGYNVSDCFIDANFEWACDNCLQGNHLKKKKAILANPGVQNTPWTPHLAYSDSKIICSTCQNEYIFTKEEKKVWYESYQLPTTAFPYTCLACRRKNSENKILSEILKKEEKDITPNELNRVIEIYTSWEKIEKAKYYQSLLKRSEL